MPVLMDKNILKLDFDDGYTRGLCRGAAGNPRVPRLLPGTLGNFPGIPGLGRSPGEGNGNPLQYSCLENPMDGGAC